MLLGPILDAPLEEWERMVRVNVLGLPYVSQAALPHLIRAADDGPRRVADLVNVSSVAGRRANQGATRQRHVAVNEMLVRPTEQVR